MLLAAAAIAAVFAAAAASAAVQEVVRLVADITTSPKTSGFSSPTVINDELYFVATDGQYGSELWKTDGTNVTRLTDISYGTLSSFIATPTLYNGEIYFRGASTAPDGLVDVELWKWDGANSSLVANIKPGETGSTPTGLTVYNGVLYFAANDGSTGNELWAFDGSSAYQVADLNPGAGSSNPSGLTVFAGYLCFSASNNITDPVDLKWTANSNFYVLSGSTPMITEFDASGTSIRSLSGIGTAPTGLDVGDSGSVYVAISGNNQVWKFLPTSSSFQADTNFGIARYHMPFTSAERDRIAAFRWWPMDL